MPPKKQLQTTTASTTQNRLVIRDIEVENFKSYAGKHRIGPFHKTFTTVIGPNGSGKSNVIDSMLFVFGKKSSKIRVAKFTELIHNSAAHPHVPSASVTVNFVEIIDDATDPAQREEVEGTGFSVTRKVSKASGTSTYYIDHKPSSQNEVVELLKSKGVDLDHNRFLILQGEVEQIAMMKPRGEKEGEEGLVEYFDDLIGTNSMLDQITEASTKANKAYDDRLEMLATLKDAEKSKNEMQSARDACVNYITMENNLQRAISLMVQCTALNLRDEMKDNLVRLNAINKRKKGHEERLASIKEECKRISGLGNAARAEKENLSQEVKKAETEKSRAEEQLAEKKAALESHEKTRKRDQDRVKKHREEINKLKLEQGNFSRDREIANQRKQEAIIFIEENEDDYERRKTELEQSIIPLRRKENQLIEGLRPFQRGLSAAEEELNNAQSALQNLERVTQERAKNIHHLETRIQNNKQQLGAFEERIQESDSASSNLRERLVEAQEEREEATNTLRIIADQIEARKSQFKNEASDDQITSFLCSQSTLKGYIGPLRTLGRIDERFDIAAGVAGGGVWGFHVVDNEDTAAAAMQLLKRENRGRASFIPLSKISHEWGNQVNQNFECPRGARRLFDLIECEDRMKPAFYFAVRNTVLAENLNRARELGLHGPMHQRLRCVTAEGGLVEPAGVLSGGGQRPRGAELRGSGGSVQSNAKRQEVMKQLQELQAQLQQANHAKNEAQQRVNQLEMEIRNKCLSGADHQKMLRSIMGIKNTIANDEQQLKFLLQQQEDSGDTDTRRAELQQTVEQFTRTVQSKSEEMKERRRELEEVKQNIENAGGVEFKQFEDRLAEMRNQRNDSENKLSDLRRHENKVTSRIEILEKEVEKIEEKLQASATEERERDREAVAQLHREVAVLSDKVRQCKAAVGDVEDRIDDLKKKMEDERNKIRFEEDKIQECAREAGEVDDALKPQKEKMLNFREKKRLCEQIIIDNAKKYGAITVGGVGGRAINRSEGDDEDDDAQKTKNRRRKKRNNSDDDSDEEDEEEEEEEEEDDEDPLRVKKEEKGQDGVRTLNQHADPANSSSPSEGSWRLSQDAAMAFGSPSSTQQQRDSQRSLMFSPNSSQQQQDGDGANNNNKNTITDDGFDESKFTTTVPERDLRVIDFEGNKKMAREIHIELQSLKEQINFQAVGEYLRLDAKYKKIKSEHDEVLATYQHFHALEDQLREERRVKFLKTFGVIQHKLKEVYQTITRSGDAELELVDSSDPFEGIRFTVRPPRKAWKAIGNLSGGEKTLSSLALVFALHHIRPTPVYVLDEIDAALDFRNVAIVGKYILEKGIGAQFIIISLRNNMFELAHQIVGISKVNDCTRSIVISPQFLSGRIKEACMGGALRLRQQQQQQQMMMPQQQQQNQQQQQSLSSQGGENMVPSPQRNKKHRPEEEDE